MSAVLAGCVLAALGLVVGYFCGRRAEVQRQVDAVLRRETRFRHPVAQPVDECVGGVSLDKLAEWEESGG